MKLLRLRACRITLNALLTVLLLTAAQAQTFQVIHSFTGLAEGGEPLAGVSIDRAGNVYGTVATGNFGSRNALIYKLVQKNGTWIFSELYEFSSNQYEPSSRPAIAANGTLFGTTPSGGISCDPVGCGVVYHLTPPPTVCRSSFCPWNATMAYQFVKTSNAPINPNVGDLLFDRAGNIYGVTTSDGNTGSGAVYQLSPSGRGWAETTLYVFTGKLNNGDGWQPASGVIADGAGNLYGTTESGGSNSCTNGCGTVYQLTRSGFGWTEKILYTFQGGIDGQNPVGGLVFDQAGNLYGTASNGGVNGGGTVYKLTPTGNNNWAFSILYSLSGCNNCGGPQGSLILDSSGNLYGTTHGNGSFNYGTVFKLSPSNGDWNYTDLHDFTNRVDGAYPDAGLSLDSHGNLIGAGGSAEPNLSGTVWEITPQ